MNAVKLNNNFKIIDLIVCHVTEKQNFNAKKSQVPAVNKLKTVIT